MIVFGGILIHQASWQLFGASRPKFIAFMQLHDRRLYNPAHRIQRGRILDHHGAVLAYSDERLGHVFRIYPMGEAFAHVVGYNHPWYGSTGMEAVATAPLNGGAPADLFEWGQRGRELLTGDKRPSGRDLTLTLDAGLQREAFRLLQHERGAVIAIEPTHGAIRALVSTPSFDPNRLEPALFAGRDTTTPFLNRATQGLYPPGSVYKIVLALLAIENGFVGSFESNSNGFTTSPRYRAIRDYEYYLAQNRGGTWAGHGRIDLATAFSRSSNVFFAQLGVSLGHESFYRINERLLINQQIPIAESPYGSWSMRTGSLPPLNPSDRYGLAQMSIGQGQVLVTPAYLALITAAIANGGLAVRPRLVENDTIEVLGPLTSPDHAMRLSHLLRRVVTEGTARGIARDHLPIAGKTGTAENAGGAAHSWFVGFAPAHRPRLVIAVLIEHGGAGSRVAAPLALRLFEHAAAHGLLE
ncbi:peptidoglycan glycosyltransferase [Thiocapsa imhoffii]|uniref:Peptidoglycan glycosyltransferase n=1 Tax=Thiocapsa imhoffii TaxID=382777 RepID=A0A9X0WLL4_9GAMM|nr:peptidoglycan glycosyltransferase [Thiocapsa imhoffii]